MNEHHSYNVWQNIWEGFSQGVTSACGELGMQKMALRERTVAGCGGGGGIAQWQCVFLWLRQSLRFVKWMSTFLHALRRRGWLCFWHPAAFVSVDHRLWNRRRSLNLPPGFVEENLHSFFFTRLAMGVVGGTCVMLLNCLLRSIDDSMICSSFSRKMTWSFCLVTRFIDVKHPCLPEEKARMGQIDE